MRWNPHVYWVASDVGGSLPVAYVVFFAVLFLGVYKASLTALKLVVS